jgi:aryl-alcohol dehydrogenase-like predicted oxidoreductase
MAGRTSAHHAIQWLLDQKGVQSVIVGVKTIEQLRQILQPFA